MARLNEDQVVNGVAGTVEWWIGKRVQKFRKNTHETASINPFLAPIIMALHRHDVDQLATLLMQGHLVGSHATGFGKLLDEKVMPQVFGTFPLNGKSRKGTIYQSDLYDEIDHIMPDEDGTVGKMMLSLKTGRWTIQLGQAKALNSAIAKLLAVSGTEGHPTIGKVVVGAFTGTAETLSDKFDVAMGVQRETSANHDVIALPEGRAEVRAGRELWSFVNGSEPATQDWVMSGILQGIERGRGQIGEMSNLEQQYLTGFRKRFAKFMVGDSVDWHAFLEEVNG